MMKQHSCQYQGDRNRVARFADPNNFDAPGATTESVSTIVIIVMFYLSAATLMFEINLARLYSITQFYHFAFMIISLAMLGFGASGAWLALFPRLGRRQPRRALAWLACGYGVTSLGAYLVLNWLPFDSFSIAWDRR
jgi:hypothetical protein